MGTRKIGFSLLLNAVYDRIDTHALTSTYRVFDYVPKDDDAINTDFPFVTIGEVYGGRSYSFGAQVHESEDNVITVHVWSDYKGKKECADMLNNIVQALTSSDFAFAGYTMLLKLVDDYSIIIDDTEPANPIYHGIIRFRQHMA